MQLAFCDDYLKGTRKCLVFSSLPMEILADCDVVQHERGFGKGCRKIRSFEIQFVVQGPVIFDFSFSEDCPALSGSVRKYLKINHFRSHNSDIQKRLSTDDTIYYPVLLLLSDGYFADHFRKKLLGDCFKFLLHRHDENASHIRAARAHGKMVGTFGKIMMGTVAASENHD